MTMLRVPYGISPWALLEKWLLLSDVRDWESFSRIRWSHTQTVSCCNRRIRFQGNDSCLQIPITTICERSRRWCLALLQFESTWTIVVPATTWQVRIEWGKLRVPQAHSFATGIIRYYDFPLRCQRIRHSIYLSDLESEHESAARSWSPCWREHLCLLLP